MKRTLLVIRVLSVVSLIAVLAASAFPQSVQAARKQAKTAIVSSDRQETSYGWWHECVGEMIWWNGVTQWNSKVTVDNIGRVHTSYKGQSHLDGLSDSGEKYVGEWTQSSSWIDKGTGPWVHTLKSMFTVTGDRSGVVLNFHETREVTINTDGTVTVNILKSVDSCK